MTNTTVSLTKSPAWIVDRSRSGATQALDATVYGLAHNDLRAISRLLNAREMVACRAELSVPAPRTSALFA